MTRIGLRNVIFINLFSLSILSTVIGQSLPNDIVLLNTGEMNIHTGGVDSVAMYVPYAMRAGGQSSVVLNGQLNLGGHFYQDAVGSVFSLNPATGNSVGYSAGKIRFVKSNNTERLIAPLSRTSQYDRAQNFVAFPYIVLASNDNLVIGAESGIDALGLKRDPGFNGKIILQSDRTGNDVYDASLRITGSGSSSALVEPGLVVVEREMSYYRSGVGSEKLFGFATPFYNTQYSGYFAGNWVRKPSKESSNGHTRFVFADQKGSDNLILQSLYVVNPLEVLEPGQAYLIKPRPPGFAYSTLVSQGNGLSLTGAESSAAYDQSKFSFNGKVYGLSQYNEQLFAENTLFSQSITGTVSSTVNWLIGNSYTAPIDVLKLAEAMKNSSLKFSPNIWVWPAGATTYEAHRITGTDNVSVATLSSIPPMTVFMIRVQAGSATGTFSIGKDMLTHEKVTHNRPGRSQVGHSRAPAAVGSQLLNQVVLRVSPEDNENIYDLTAVGIREAASEGSDIYDQQKVYNEADIFQLYTLSAQNIRLSSNGIPPTVRTVRLSFKPVSSEAVFVIKATNQSTLQSEGLWLEDRRDGVITDLMMTDTYSFTSDPDDYHDRFVLHFIAPVSADFNAMDASGVSIYNNAGKLIIRNLSSDDLGSEMRVFDASGQLLMLSGINDYPRMEFGFQHNQGVYVVQIRGKRNILRKFIISR